jgi:murein DD-endopeptidase MepM/ murein hydrolase activator NlpD
MRGRVSARAWLSVALLLVAGACATGGPEICANFKATGNCAGGARGEMHHGIDFRGEAGTEVISATYGTVVRTNYSECPGYSITVKTDFSARDGDVEGPVYAIYVHTQALAGLQIAQKLRPGDPIGKIIPLRNTSCYGSATHTHYELRVRNQAVHYIDPHAFWTDGPGKVTCFTPGMEVPPGKTVAPLRCER